MKTVARHVVTNECSQRLYMMNSGVKGCRGERGCKNTNPPHQGAPLTRFHACGTTSPLTRNEPLRPGQAGLASYRHVERLAFALLRFHNLWMQPQLFIFGSPLAYQSFCQQRKEELAIVCSFSGEHAATGIYRDAVAKVVR
jgi:hypothetical protein